MSLKQIAAEQDSVKAKSIRFIAAVIKSGKNETIKQAARRCAFRGFKHASRRGSAGDEVGAGACCLGDAEDACLRSP